MGELLWVGSRRRCGLQDLPSRHDQSHHLGHGAQRVTSLSAVGRMRCSPAAVHSLIVRQVWLSG
jgi:hypothetical protein